MIIKIINEMNKKYNLDLKYKLKLTKIYIITFKINDQELTFNYMIDSLKNYQENMRDFEAKLNKEIIEFYKRKVK